MNVAVRRKILLGNHPALHEQASKAKLDKLVDNCISFETRATCIEAKVAPPLRIICFRLWASTAGIIEVDGGAKILEKPAARRDE